MPASMIEAVQAPRPEDRDLYRLAPEQTFIVPLPAMALPDKSPIAILERMAGAPLRRRV